MIQSDESFKTGIGQLESAKETISAFFDSGLPKEHRKDLKKWRNFVINEKQYKGRHGAAHVVAQYEENIKLLEAAYTLITYQETLSNVSTTPLSDPLQIIKKIFKNISIQQYKEILHEWLHLALSNKAAGETLSPKDVIVVYDNLRRLYAASWLFHHREKLL